MRAIIKLIKKTYQMAGPQESQIVLKNVMSLSGLQIITYLLPIVILPYLFQILGPARFGLIAFAQAFVQYFMIMTDYGFSVSATKEISLCHNDNDQISKVFASVMTIKMLLLILSTLILMLVVYCVPRFKNDWMIYVLSFGAVIGNTIFPVWFFQGTEKMKYTAKINIIGEFLYAFSIFFFVRQPTDYLNVVLITSGVSIITALMGQYIVFARFGVRFKLPDYTHIHRQLIAGWNVFISVLAINAYTTTRLFAVGLLTNNTTTGFYSIAEKIANVAQTFPLWSFSQAIFPRLSKIFHKDKVKAFEMMQHIQSITIKISLICLPVIFITAPFIVGIVCGGSYSEVVFALRLLLISVFFIASNAFRVQFLLVCGQTKTYSLIHLTMAIIGLPLIILLIYCFSYVGAAASTVAIEGGILMLTLMAVKKLKFS